MGKILPSWLTGSSPANVNKVVPEEATEPSIAYLDVHCGVSIGLMAGIDIGHLNRSEYFLVGDPIARAAEAEGQAQKGEVVLCPRAHRLLHNKELANQLAGNRNNAGMDLVSLRSPSKHLNPVPHHIIGNAACGCTETIKGYF